MRDTFGAPKESPQVELPDPVRDGSPSKKPPPIVISGPNFETLEEAREYVQAGLQTGTSCPCCGQVTKLYSRKMYAGIGRWLVWLVQRYRVTGDWIDVKASPVRGGDYAKLVYWGLAESQDKGEAKWRPTTKGDKFVFETVQVRAYAYVFNGNVFGFGGDRIGIRDVLGAQFDLDELLGRKVKNESLPGLGG